MKRDTLRLSQHQSVETGLDWNGRYYVAYSGGASVFIRDTKGLRRFLKIPKSIPMRESLESWLASLEAQDAERKDRKPEAPAPAMTASSFDPLAHDIDNENTRTVI